MTVRKKILFVCLGNICRSPLAEGVFQHIVDEAGKSDSYYIDSAGLLDYHTGSSPDHRSVSVAAGNNIKLDHKARQVREDDFYTYDLIVAMDRQNMAQLERIRPDDAKAKIYLMRNWDTTAPDKDVPDPYQGSIKDFEDVYEMVLRSSSNLFSELEKLKGN